MTRDRTPPPLTDTEAAIAASAFAEDYSPTDRAVHALTAGPHIYHVVGSGEPCPPGANVFLSAELAERIRAWRPRVDDMQPPAFTEPMPGPAPNRRARRAAKARGR